MVAISDEKCVLVHTHQSVPNGRIQVFTIYWVTICYVIKYLDCVKDHYQPLNGWLGKHKNLGQVLSQSIGHAQLLYRAGRWMPELSD
jgi:hypothetical protein